MSRDWGNYQQTDGMSGGGESSPEFSRLSQLISSNIQKIQQNVSQIQRMVEQVGTQQDSQNLRDRLQEVQHNTNDLAKDTNTMLKDLSSSITSDQRQYKLQKERLANDLLTVLNNFQAAQRIAVQKTKASVLRARANSNIPGSGVEFNSPAEPSAPAQRLQIEQNVDLQAIREREQAIRELEDDIVGVNTIFKDLATMVHEQGDMIDSIEQNVEQAAVSVEHGGRNIQKASTYQTSARKKKLICFILLIVLIVILVLAIYFGTKK